MSRPLIIVVNADWSFLEMLSEFLEEEGYQALPIKENGEPFEIIKRRMPQLVFLELLSTDPDRGWMVLNKMRLDPKTSRIPVIIASTGTQLIRDNEQHLRAKGCEILLKPFDLEELLTLVGRLVSPSAA